MDVWYEGIDVLADSVYNNGPHTVAVYANAAWKRYDSGIFDDSDCSTTAYNPQMSEFYINVSENTRDFFLLI